MRGSENLFPEDFVREFKPLEDVAFGQTPARFEVNGPARGIMGQLYDIVFENITKDIAISNNTWKLTFEGDFTEPEEEGKE